MAATPRIKVQIAGAEQILTVRPVGMMAVERKFGGQAFQEHPIEAMLYGAFVSEGSPGDFDTWAGRIEEFLDETPVDPTLATPPEPSPPSL